MSSPDDGASAGAEAAHAATLQLALAVGLVGISLWRVDLATQRIHLNDWGYALIGHRPQPGGMPLADMRACIHEDDRQAVVDAAQRALQSDSIVDAEARYRRPDGSYRTLLTRRIAERDAQGRPVALVGVSLDMTERRDADEQRRARLAAEAANRAKTVFLSRMSHELRTPLNAVLGFAQLMLRDEAEPLATRQRERGQRIVDAAGHLLSLIEDVLDLSAIESGALHLLSEPVPLAPIVTEAVDWFAPEATRAGVDLQVGLIDAVAKADARRVRQVLANLLSNAIKYNQRGGWVEVSSIDRDDGFTGLRVRDSGCGMGPQQLQQLFEPFNRLGAERGGVAGTGIGLSIVRALLDGMGGQIEVRSNPGAGSEFTAWLPRAPAGAAATIVAAPSGAPAPVPPALDVLCIEDNAVNLLLVAQMVALRPRMRLHTAQDGRSGIERALAVRPHVVLLDLQLPDMEGLEVLRRLRHEPALANTRLIALSANALPDDIARARRAGFDDYWTKPIHVDRFLAGLDVLASQAARVPAGT
ncbi:MAG TPA: ATP-binding protein [Burkholderiaceae bacterium]|nr:ATP-binding protein [Burkholderiaceae bacterium]